MTVCRRCYGPVPIRPGRGAIPLYCSPACREGKDATTRAADAALIEAFNQAQRRRNFSPKTIHTRTNVLENLAKHGPGLMKTTKRDVEAFLDSRPLGPQSRYSYTAHIHSFFNWAVRAEVLTIDPTATIDRPRLPKRLPKPIPQGELDRALEGADAEMRCWLLLGALAGFRVSDMAGLRREDIGDTEAPPALHINQGKGKKDRTVPMHPRVTAALLALGLPESGHVFTDSKGRPLAPNTVGIRISDHLHRIGVQRSAHSLRHAFGSAVYRASRDLMLTRTLMGHSSVQTTMGYVEINPDEAATAVVCGL